MNLDKYQQAWKADAAELSVEIDFDSLSAQVQKSHDQFRSTIFWRDVREVGVSFSMIPIWFALGIGLALPWSWWLGIPALIWVAGFMLIDRKRHPKTPSAPGQPLLFYAKESLAQVEHQIWLLRNVFWWYLFPFVLAASAFFLQVGWDLMGTWWGCVLVAAPFAFFLLLLYRWVYRINQSTVTEQFLPRRDQLRNIVTTLQGDGGDFLGLDDLVDHVGSLSVTDQKVGSSPGMAAWSENWNRIVPSWWIAGMILSPTLIGAYCGYRFAFDQAGPVFFQSAVSSVILFEIMFFGRYYYVTKKGKDIAVSKTGTARPHAPAIFVLVLLLVVSALAIAAIISFVAAAKSHPTHAAESIDVSGPLVTDEGYATVAPFTQVRWEGQLPIVQVDGNWLRLRSIDGISIEDIVACCHEQYDSNAQKRFTEDLVQVLFEMGHDPDWEVALEFETADGTTETSRVRMTSLNRRLARFHFRLQTEVIAPAKETRAE